MTIPAMMEKKQSTIKQTAAKIKTKIHNTSSFFKLSLKTNNKALALALAAQKQRTRQLETETVCLQKDVQALRFELAIQRHKNKEMFTILREFYNNSINCMAKAVDLISKEEASISLDTHISEDASQSEKDENELFPEQRNMTSPSKCLEQVPVLTTAVDVSAVNDYLPRRCSVKSTANLPSPDKDHTTPQITLYDSEMEMTVVDNVAEIVTVQTNPKVSCEDDQGRCGKSKKSCLLKNRDSVMSSKGDTPVDATSLNYISVCPPVEAASEAEASMNTCNFTSSRKEKSLSREEQGETPCGATELVTARRKTHVTSRGARSNKITHNSQKHTEGNSDARKTYVVSSHSSNVVSSNNDLEDYFSDLQAPRNEKVSKQSSHDIASSDTRTESEDEAQVVNEPQKGVTNQRKTFVISHKSRSNKSRKSRVPSLSVGQNTSHMKESTQFVDSDAHVMEISVQAEKHNSRMSAQSLFQAEEPSTVKNRGTYVIHASKMSVYSDILNDAVDIQEDAGCGEMVNTRTSNDEISQHTVLIERPPEEQEVCAPVLTKASTDKKLLENSSQLSPIGQLKSKDPRTEVNMKVSKKKIAAREKKNASGKKKGSNCSSTQNVDILAAELPGPVDSNNEKENSTSNTELLQSTVSQRSPLEGCFREAPRKKTGNANSIHSMNFDSCGDTSTIDDLGNGLSDTCLKSQSNGHKSKCRETYVVPSNCSLSKEKEKSMTFNQGSEDSILTNGESEMSLVADERTFIPHHSSDNQSTPRKTEHLRQKQSELFTEDRPPWESLEFGSAEIYSCDSPGTASSPSPDISSQTMDIYEEPGWNMTQQTPDERAMKSLTNTDLTSNASGRTRRKAANVSYKEPPLNCKMRRGDKFSDTRFLSSPLFKDKRKKRMKKNNV